MELSFASRPQPDNAAKIGPAVRREPGRPILFDIPVPEDLHPFGPRICASALGDPAGPPVVVLGGISADCFPAVKPDGSPGWWPGLTGHGRAVDPGRYHVLGVSFAADETGATAPSTLDQARVLAAALDWVGVDQPAIIVGASYGAMVGLALAEAQPHRVERLVIISAGVDSHPRSTAARELQRRVVSLGILTDQGDEALAIARGMAMLTYRSPEEFRERFNGGISDSETSSSSEPGAYLRARGGAFRSIMSPQRFLSLSASIDRHRVRPEKIAAPCLLIGATSDQLVVPDELRRMAKSISGPCQLHLLDSLFGHDMFLKEAERVGKLVAPFLANQL
jgi:homoserine O-acetyltransferase